FLDGGIDKHFQLIELVDTNDAAGVFSCGSGFAAVAGRVASKPDWAVAEVKNFISVVTGQGNFGGTDQVEVVLFDAVDLVVMLDVESGTVHGFWAYQGWRNDWCKPGFGRLCHAHLGQRHFELSAHTFEEVEARTRDFCSAFHVNGAQQLTKF